MKIVVGIIVFAFLTAGGVFLYTNQTLTPKQVVILYNSLSLQGKFEELRTYTTTPNEYLEMKLNAIKQEADSKNEKHSSSPKPILGNGQQSLEDPWLFYVNDDFPKITHQKREILKRVSNIWVKQNQAKVRVVLGFEDVKDDGMEWDFLLYRRNNEWKIFQIQPPIPSDNYAISEN